MVVVDLAEESLRIIKALKKSKDPQSSWSIDVGDLLGSYLQAIESSEQLAREYEATHEHDENDAFNEAKKHPFLPTLNFSTASTIVSEATRVFSRKVDYLAVMVETTMMNLTSGAIMGGKTKKSKLRERKLNQKIRGFQALQDWNLQAVPEAADLLHIPWSAWSKGVSQLLPEEECLYAREIAALIASDAPFTEYQESVLGAQWRFPPAPRCLNPRELADKKKQCIFRPLISLMPRPEDSSSSTQAAAIGPAAVRQLIASSKLASSDVNSGGCLSMPFCARYLQPGTRYEGTPLMGGTPFVGSAAPDVPTTKAGRVSFGDDSGGVAQTGGVPQPGGGVMQPGGGVIQTGVPSRRIMRRAPGGVLDEHERLGRDAELKVGKPYSMPVHPELYGVKLMQVDYGAVSLLTVRGLWGLQKFLQSDAQTQAQIYQQVCDWKVKCKVKGARKNMKIDPAKLPTHFPLYEDVRRPDPPLKKMGYSDHKYAVLTDKLTKLIRQTNVRQSGDIVYADEYCGGEEEGGVQMPTDEAPLVGDESRIPGDEGVSDSEGFNWTSDSLFNNVVTAAQQQFDAPLTIFKPAADQSSMYRMHERVWKWSQRVETWIVRTASLGPFIVSDYVKKIADRVKDAMLPKESLALVESPKEQAISFKKLVEGCERHEVCRLFLTSLVLANNHGFKLQTIPGESGGCEELLIWGDQISAEKMTVDHFERPVEDEPKKKRAAPKQKGPRKHRKVDSGSES